MSLERVGFVELPPHAHDGGFDHAAVHEASGRIYVAHTANDAIDVIDVEAQRYVRVHAGKHLLHLEFGSRAAPGDAPRPAIERLTVLAPVLFGGIPRSESLEVERDEPERANVEAPARDVTREVRVASVAPMLAFRPPAQPGLLTVWSDQYSL
jgi:hypothetical protein